MSQFSDEQVQQLLDAGLSLPDRGSAAERNEVRLYKQLFDELKQELPIRPDTDFSTRVVSRIGARKARSADSFSYGWFVLGVVICLVAGLSVAAPFNWRSAELSIVLTSLQPFKWVLIFGMSSLILLQLLDLKLVREPSLPKLT